MTPFRVPRLTAWTNYLDFDSDFALFGGSIVPLFQRQPPKWLVASKFNFSMMFAERDLPEGPTDAGSIYGGNMAVRKTIIDKGFRFDENIGPNALDSGYPMGGETELCVRVAQSGAKCCFAQATTRSPHHRSETARIEDLGETGISHWPRPRISIAPARRGRDAASAISC